MYTALEFFAQYPSKTLANAKASATMAHSGLPVPWSGSTPRTVSIQFLHRRVCTATRKLEAPTTAAQPLGRRPSTFDWLMGLGANIGSFRAHEPKAKPTAVSSPTPPAGDESLAVRPFVNHEGTIFRKEAPCHHLTPR